MDNPETLAIWGTANIVRGQTKQNAIKMRNIDPTKHRECTKVPANGKQFLFLRRSQPYTMQKGYELRINTNASV